MTRFFYTYATDTGQHGEFTVDERSECIANVQAKMEVERRVNPLTLVAFDLVAQRPAS